MDIGVLNTRPTHDPYHMDTRQPSHTFLTYDPEGDVVSADQEYDDNSTSAHRWHGREIVLRVYAWPSESDLREFIEDHAKEFAAIRTGYQVRWDGSNHVGSLDEDGSMGVESIRRDLEHIEGFWEWWAVDEWCEPEMMAISGYTTDEELAARSTEWELAAKDAHVVLDGAILPYITERRDTLRWIVYVNQTLGSQN